MAFPTIRSSSTPVWTLSTTIAYPPTVQAGDVLIWFSLVDRTTAESGWTLLADHGAGDTLFIQYKIADGTEGGGSFTAASSHYGRFMVAVDAGAFTLLEAVTATPATSDTPNPPALTPSAGSDDYLWIVWGMSPTEAAFTAPTPPTNFTSLGAVNGLAAAYRNYTGSTLDPGAFGDSDVSSQNHYAATVAINYRVRPSNPLFFGSNF